LVAAPDSNAGRAGNVTQLLQNWVRGDRGAFDALVPLVYAELRRIADGYLSRERQGHTLQPTALVHEAWLRLCQLDSDRSHFEHRKQFYGLAAQMMRRILVDHARALGAQKRQAPTIDSGGQEPSAPASRLLDLLALDRALEDLAAVSARQARIVELRYFAGLNVDEMAELLDVSRATISRDQRSAEAWLGHALS
jgi:RNA polymerase sigma-70 factor (ECF subfamily)